MIFKFHSKLKKIACATLALDWHFHFTFNMEKYERIFCCFSLHLFHPPCTQEERKKIGHHWD